MQLNLLLLFACFFDPPWPTPQVVSPVPEALSESLSLAPFYGKCTMVGALPVLSSNDVDDYAHLEAAHLIGQMLAHRPELAGAIASTRTRFVIMAPGEMTTKVPEHADLAPAAYWDKRARGLGATTSRPAVSCGEENLLQFPGDPYAAENILVHEFAHAIHEMGMSVLDPTFDDRLRAVYNAAMEAGLWEGAYASTNRMEYWAEGVQSWFDTNRANDNQHNHIDTRAKLKVYDPEFAALIEEVFGDGEWRYIGARERAASDTHLRGWTPGPTPTFAWPDVVMAAWDEHEASRHHLARSNDESPLQHLLRIAEANDAASQVALGWKYREGDEVDQSDERAVVWYRRAAAQQYPGGLDSLGWMYQEGRGVAEDDLVANSFYRESAALGHRQAMWNLGRQLEAGFGCAEADPVEGIAWIMRAADRGHGQAPQYLKVLRDRHDAEVMAAARMRANSFVSRGE